MQDTDQQVSPDPVKQLVRKEVPGVVRKSFLSYLAGAIGLLIVVGALSFVFGSTFYPWTGFLQIIGIIATLYAGIVYLWAKLKGSGGLGVQLYVLGFLGLSLGGFLFSWGGYSLLSAGYWERQASKNQGCKCWRDGGDLVVVGGETLACLKCSRRIRIGSDIPKAWNRVGLAAIPIGIALLAVYYALPGIPAALFVSFLGSLLLYDGLVLGILPFSYQQSLGGYVRIPEDESDSTSSPDRPSTR